jgi:hypothetical protein
MDFQKIKKYGIIAGVILVVFLISIAVFKVYANEISATGTMTEYVTYRSPEATNPRIQCQPTDTDGNGYVSCEAMFQVDGKDARPLIAECPVFFSMNDKCRQPRNTFQ